MAASKLLSLNEVSFHSTSADAWVVVNSKVYDVTEYILEHPGGAEGKSNCYCGKPVGVPNHNECSYLAICWKGCIEFI